MTWAIDVAAEDISHHLGEDLQVPDPATTLSGSSGACAAASPHPWHSSVPKSGGAQPVPIISETAAVGWRVVRCFALTVREKDWLFWATRAATQRFATSFCLLPSHPVTCEPAGWFHQLWPAAWRSQSLLSSCVFRENHLKTQNLLIALGCCQTSVLSRHWRIHTGAQPCQEICGRPSVFDSQLTETPVSFLIPLRDFGCVPSWHIKGKIKRERRGIFPILYSLLRTLPMMLCLEPSVSTETLAPGRFQFI